VNNNSGEVENNVNNNSGEVQNNVNNNSGEVQNNVNNSGEVQNNVNNSGEVQNNVNNNSGEVQNKYTTTEGAEGNVCVGESDRRLKETAYNEELQYLCCSPNVVQQAWDGTDSYTVLVRECDEKMKLVGPKHRREDNIKLFIKEAGYVDVD
jgi:hypothetical protein